MFHPNRSLYPYVNPRSRVHIHELKDLFHRPALCGQIVRFLQDGKFIRQTLRSKFRMSRDKLDQLLTEDIEPLPNLRVVVVLKIWQGSVPPSSC